MSPEELRKECADCYEQGLMHVRLVREAPFGRIPGFPRGELLLENERDGRRYRVYRYPILKILRWLDAHG
jgi:hypothetical protein